jgi:protein gp37
LNPLIAGEVNDMAEKTGITWTDHTFNPWWGCVEVSPGCDNCYARTDAHRYGHEVWGKDAGRRFFGEKHWNEPRKWNKQALAEGRRHRVFCASMADIGEANPALDAEKAKLWHLIRETPYLDWLLLTKRPAQLVNHLPDDWGEGWPQVWLGTTVENNDYRWRIRGILKAPAGAHFLSVEPQIGPVDLRDYLTRTRSRYRVDWVIIGGESGVSARGYVLEWARDVIAVCREFDVTVFNKQLGTVAAKELHLIHRKGADPNEWPADLQVQDFPKSAYFEMPVTRD